MAVVGFIGTGNMGGALARAAAGSGACGRLLLANRGREKAEALAAETGGEVVDNLTAAADADYLFIGVEPDMMREVVSSLKDVLAERAEPPVVVSMAAGKDIETISSWLPAGTPVIRIMPNIAVSVGSGVILYCLSPEVTEAQKEGLLAILSRAGVLSELEERLIGAAAGITGCGTAFVAVFAEALADGGVACGLPRERAAAYACEMIAGSARLILESGKHSAEIKDMVCSPGGSTIQGVRALEQGGFRAAAMNAVIAAYEKKF